MPANEIKDILSRTLRFILTAEEPEGIGLNAALRVDRAGKARTPTGQIKMFAVDNN